MTRPEVATILIGGQRSRTNRASFSPSIEPGIWISVKTTWIGEARDADVASFAEALQEFEILELSTIGIHAGHRRTFLDFLDQLVQNAATLEKDVHKAFENNLWMLGRKYALLSSNVTLKNVIGNYCDSKFTGSRAAKRPDLLLSQDFGDSYLLIEFKRPSHSITRDDVAQAEKYRDDLSPRLSSTSKMEIVLIGKGRSPGFDANRLHETVAIQSYASVISSARTELDWLITSLASPQGGPAQTTTRG
jgi:hypothetical protein